MMLIIHAVGGGLVILAGLVLLTGRGSFMISGYNNMAENEKAKYDAPALCRFVGKIVLPLGILIVLAGIDSITHHWWFWPVWGALMVGLMVFVAIYPNRNNRFMK